ncbi:MAG: phosphotransferase [Armatimonas sp.]
MNPEVQENIAQALGKGPLEDFAPIPGGKSGAQLYGFHIGPEQYIVKCSDPARPFHTLRAEHEYACARAAAERGVAPAVYYTSVEQGISVIARVNGNPFRGEPGQIERLTTALQKLHSGPAFPAGQKLSTVLTSIQEQVRSQNEEGLPPFLFQTLSELVALLEKFPTAPCHHDLNPTNLLDTGEQVYFFDWDTACMSDPYIDLAQLGVFGLPPFVQQHILATYLGHAPTEIEQAHYQIAHLVALGFYSAAFLQLVSWENKSLATLADPLSMPELLQALGARSENATPDVIASSLVAEFNREAVLPEFTSAKQTLSSLGQIL